MTMRSYYPEIVVVENRFGTFVKKLMLHETKPDVCAVELQLPVEFAADFIRGLHIKNKTIRLMHFRGLYEWVNKGNENIDRLMVYASNWDHPNFHLDTIYYDPECMQAFAVQQCVCWFAPFGESFVPSEMVLMKQFLKNKNTKKKPLTVDEREFFFLPGTLDDVANALNTKFSMNELTELIDKQPEQQREALANFLDLLFKVKQHEKTVRNSAVGAG